MAKLIPVDGVTDWLSQLFQRLNNGAATGEDVDASYSLLHNLTTGSSTAYVLTLEFNPSAMKLPAATYKDGLLLSMRAHVACGDNPTLDTNAIGAKNIKRWDGGAVLANDWAANQNIFLIYDSVADDFKWIGGTLAHDHTDVNNGGDLLADSIIKGWVTFNGTTGAIIASFNVASVQDNGTGDFTVTWDTNFADANYAVAYGGGRRSSVNQDTMHTNTKAAGTLRIDLVADGSGANVDVNEDMCVFAIGDQ